MLSFVIHSIYIVLVNSYAKFISVKSEHILIYLLYFTVITVLQKRSEGNVKED